MDGGGDWPEIGESGRKRRRPVAEHCPLPSSETEELGEQFFWDCGPPSDWLLDSQESGS